MNKHTVKLDSANLIGDLQTAMDNFSPGDVYGYLLCDDDGVWSVEAPGNPDYLTTGTLREVAYWWNGFVEGHENALYEALFTASDGEFAENRDCDVNGGDLVDAVV